jgi:hypothetical protein
MPSPRVHQVGTSAGGAADRLIGFRSVIKTGILGPPLNTKSERWALVEKDDCHRIVPHLCGAPELHGFHVRTSSAVENLNIRQIPHMRDRMHVPEGGTIRRTGQGRWRTFFHAGCYGGPAQAETPGIYVGMLVLLARCAPATALGAGFKRDEPRRGWAAGLTEQGRRGCNGVYGAGDKVDFRS